jgi:hypothetical protein
MDDVLLRIVLERLDGAGLPGEVEALVLAACDGAEGLAAVLGGHAVAKTVGEPAAASGDPAGAYLGVGRGGGLSRHRAAGGARACPWARADAGGRQERVGQVELRRGARAAADQGQPPLEPAQRGLEG